MERIIIIMEVVEYYINMYQDFLITILVQKDIMGITFEVIASYILNMILRLEYNIPIKKE